jgi:hypothetical protein
MGYISHFQIKLYIQSELSPNRRKFVQSCHPAEMPQKAILNYTSSLNMYYYYILSIISYIIIIILLFYIIYIIFDILYIIITYIIYIIIKSKKIDENKKFCPRGRCGSAEE